MLKIDIPSSSLGVVSLEKTAGYGVQHSDSIYSDLLLIQKDCPDWLKLEKCYVFVETGSTNKV